MNQFWNPVDRPPTRRNHGELQFISVIINEQMSSNRYQKAAGLDLPAWQSAWRVARSFPVAELMIKHELNKPHAMPESVVEAVAEVILATFSPVTTSNLVLPSLRLRLKQSRIEKGEDFEEEESPDPPVKARTVAAEVVGADVRSDCFRNCFPSAARVAPAPPPPRRLSQERPPSPRNTLRLQPIRVRSDSLEEFESHSPRPGAAAVDALLEDFLCEVLAHLSQTLDALLLPPEALAAAHSLVTALDSGKGRPRAARGGCVDAASSSHDVDQALLSALTCAEAVERADAGLRQLRAAVAKSVAAAGASLAAAAAEGSHSPRSAPSSALLTGALLGILRIAAAIAREPVLVFAPMKALLAAAGAGVPGDAPPRCLASARAKNLALACSQIVSAATLDAAAAPPCAEWLLALLCSFFADAKVVLLGNLPGTVRLEHALQPLGADIRWALARSMFRQNRKSCHVARRSVLADSQACLNALHCSALIDARFFSDQAVLPETAADSEWGTGAWEGTGGSKGASTPVRQRVINTAASVIATPSNIELETKMSPLKAGGSTGHDAETARTLEAGEGHGPRKEFFFLLGEKATSKYGEAVILLHARVSLRDETGVKHLYLEAEQLPEPMHLSQSLLSCGKIQVLVSYARAKDDGSSSLVLILENDALASALVAEFEERQLPLVLTKSQNPFFSWNESANGHTPHLSMLPSSLLLGSFSALGVAFALSPLNSAPMPSLAIPAVLARALLPPTLSRTRAASDAAHERESRSQSHRSISESTSTSHTLSQRSSVFIAQDYKRGIDESPLASRADNEPLAASLTIPKDVFVPATFSTGTDRSGYAAPAALASSLLASWLDPQMATSVQNILSLRGPALAEAVEDDCASCATTDESARAAAMAASALLSASGASNSGEMRALAAGVSLIFHGGCARLLRALGVSAVDWVESAVGGGVSDNKPCLSMMFRVCFEAKYSPGGESSSVGRALLIVYRAWARAAPQRAAAFLQFVTGTAKSPAPLLSSALSVTSGDLPPRSEKAARAVLRALPTAHACANALELPDYAAALRVLGQSKTAPSAPSNEAVAAALAEELAKEPEADEIATRILEERLSFSVEGCKGYDFDDL